MTAPLDTSYREVPLNHGQVAIVDAADYALISGYKWRAAWAPSTRSYYAVSATKTVAGKRYRVYMHRLILGLHHGDARKGDHRDTSHTLDNRRSNLRICTWAEQQMNRRMPKHNTTGFKGVHLLRKSGMYRARIRVRGELISLGTRPTAIEAYRELYVPAAIRLHGEFARIA